jgi:hypothetical protein
MDSHSHTEPPDAPALRIKAIETILTQKGLIEPAAVDEMIDTFQHRIGPATASRSSPEPGPTRNTWRGCCRMEQRR